MYYDVLIIGAGPAGAVCALLLARAGWSVALLDRAYNGPGPYKVGESLPAAVNSLLRTLALPPLQGSAHRSIPGSDSLWAGERIQQDFIMQAQGAGWRLDRLRFERDLLDQAIQSGADFKPGYLSQACHNGCAWQLKTDAGEQLQCHFLIDASGRRAVLSRILGQPREKGPPLIALWSVAKTPADTSSNARPSAQTLIESQAQGWWYAAHLPKCQTMAIFHTSAEYAAQLTKSPELWLQQLNHTTLIQKKIAIAGFAAKTLHVNEARSSVLSRPYGEHWAACGDAALSFDPLSSQGIFHAMASANMLCKTLLQGPQVETLMEYHAQLQQITEIYKERREKFYRRAYRFYGGGFWLNQISLGNPLAHLIGHANHQPE